MNLELENKFQIWHGRSTKLCSACEFECGTDTVRAIIKSACWQKPFSSLASNCMLFYISGFVGNVELQNTKRCYYVFLKFQKSASSQKRTFPWVKYVSRKTDYARTVEISVRNWKLKNTGNTPAKGRRQLCIKIVTPILTGRFVSSFKVPSFIIQ